MTLMNRLTCVLLLLLCSGFETAAAAEVVEATVCDVLANPASFDGKWIRIKAATVIAGFDDFVVEGSGCNPAGAIWLAYPEGTKGKAGPAALVRLQLAKNSGAVADAPKRAPVTLQKNGDFKKFDSLLATPYKSSAMCLACPRHTVGATLVGRLDGASVSGVVRDKSGQVTGIDGFGNMNLYRARLVLQAVSDVVPHEINYPAKGDSRRGGSATAEQLKRAIAAFGEEGESNGVLVSFGVGNEPSPGEEAKGTTDSPDGVLFHAIFDMNRLGQQLLSKAMAHVGAHIADVRGGALAQSLEEAESRAWQVTFFQ